jgi:hypothetical protein
MNVLDVMVVMVVFIVDMAVSKVAPFDRAGLP